TSGFFARGQVGRAIASGLGITAASIAAFASGLSRGAAAARTQAIVTLFCCFAVLVLSGRWNSLAGPRKNKALLPVAAGTLATLPAALLVPWCRGALSLTELTAGSLLFAVSLAAAFGLADWLLRVSRSGRGA